MTAAGAPAGAVTPVSVRSGDRRESPPLVDLVVDPPPAVPRRSAGTLMRLIPIVTALASLGMVAAMVGSGTTALKHNPMLLIFPVTLVVSAAAAAIAGSAAGQRSADVDADRRCYLEYLTALSGRLTEDAAGLRDWLESNHPAPEVLWAVAGSATMWVRPVGHSDFCVVRVATGAISAYTRLIGPTEAGSEERDPVTTAALRRFLHAHRRVTGAPITVAMAAASSVTIVGEGDRVRALVRAMICQLAALHSPADVGIAAVVGAVQSAHWDWLKWLPHHRHPTAVDDVGAARMCYRDDPDSLYTWGRDDRRIVVVVDADVSGPVPDADTTVLRIAQQDCATADIRIVTDAGETMLDGPDRMTVAQALAVARRIAGHPPARGRGNVPGGWLGRVGVVDPSRVDPIALWDARFGEPLSTPIGNAADGTFVDLDIRESAAGGVGPHGLCLGATGSGKSELLRTIVLGMLARHPPDALNLILIDFKGGATFLDLANTRHTAAVITNLADEAYLVDRLAEALTGEIDRRQQILRAAGNVASIAEYDRARQAGRLSAPLPALFIVVDEFSELLSRHPEFIDVFTAIGRLGRSLGMHLLLASQRLDEGRLRGLDSHLSYRICLKTLSANESRTAIGSPDAYHLPGRPGAAYLKVADAEPVRFQACFVSGGFEPTSPMLQSGAAAPGPALFTAAATGRVFTASTAGVVDAGPPRTLLQCLAHRLAGVGRQAHPVWLPPVADSPCLDALIPACGGGDLRVPVGLVDRTFEHVRCPLVLDLSGSAGHVAVVGAPQTGKTTALRTLVTALAATHDPRRVQVYCLDFGGGGLAALDTLPHVGSVAGRSDTALARRVATEILGVLHRREASESAAARVPAGDVFLVIDGWSAAVRQNDDGVQEAVAEVAGSGLSFGVHLVVSASRWSDIRPALRDQIGTRLELRLGDPADSEIDRSRARQVPRARPGHGVSPDGLPMVIALPGNEFRRCADNWRVPAVRLLPDRIDYEEVLSAGPAQAGLCVLGIDEEHLMPATLDFTDVSQQHLLIFGEPGSGKTSVLRLLRQEIARAHPAARVLLVDPRRTMTGSDGDGSRHLARLIETLRERIRDGVRNPESVFVLVDDYDLVSSALAPLAEVVPYSRDIGLHVVLARHSANAARALYEPLPAAVREIGAAGLQMSGRPDDGPVLSSVRLRPMPPGRGVLITRLAREQTVQLAWTEPG